jgi:hypothetical protein
MFLSEKRQMTLLRNAQFSGRVSAGDLSRGVFFCDPPRIQKPLIGATRMRMILDKMSSRRNFAWFAYLHSQPSDWCFLSKLLLIRGHIADMVSCLGRVPWSATFSQIHSVNLWPPRPDRWQAD